MISTEKLEQEVNDLKEFLGNYEKLYETLLKNLCNEKFTAKNIWNGE